MTLVGGLAKKQFVAQHLLIFGEYGLARKTRSWLLGRSLACYVHGCDIHRQLRAKT